MRWLNEQQQGALVQVFEFSLDHLIDAHIGPMHQCGVQIMHNFGNAQGVVLNSGKSHLKRRANSYKFAVNPVFSPPPPSFVVPMG